MWMRVTKFVLLAAAAMIGASGAVMAQADNDPYLWLEPFASPKITEWIETHNNRTFAELEADPRYKTYYNEALAIAEAKDRNPTGAFIAGKS